MWISANPNPKGRHGSDCVIRAISIALNMSWYEAFDRLYLVAREDCNMPSDDNVWGHFLYLMGFKPLTLPTSCPQCVTVEEFTHIFPYGTYIIGTGRHAVAVIDGNYYDTWDSGDEICSFFWTIV
jgi:hypothetical protein